MLEETWRPSQATPYRGRKLLSVSLYQNPHQLILVGVFLFMAEPYYTRSVLTIITDRCDLFIVHEPRTVNHGTWRE